MAAVYNRRAQIMHILGRGCFFGLTLIEFLEVREALGSLAE